MRRRSAVVDGAVRPKAIEAKRVGPAIARTAWRRIAYLTRIKVNLVCQSLKHILLYAAIDLESSIRHNFMSCD
jgi:hypothetical protein